MRDYLKNNMLWINFEKIQLIKQHDLEIIEGYEAFCIAVFLKITILA